VRRVGKGWAVGARRLGLGVRALLRRRGSGRAVAAPGEGGEVASGTPGEGGKAASGTPGDAGKAASGAASGGEGAVGKVASGASGGASSGGEAAAGESAGQGGVVSRLASWRPGEAVGQGATSRLASWRPPKAPRSLVVLGFDSRQKADEALLAVRRLKAQKKLVLHDAVFVTKGPTGGVYVTETVDPTPRSAALDGSVWGLLLGTLLGGPVGGLVAGALSAGTGALLAKLIDVGVPDTTVRDLRQTVRPGTTALALLLSHIDQGAVLAELRRFAGAQVVATTLSEAALTAVNEALGQKP
jgi:uncharacterized membrane protein